MKVTIPQEELLKLQAFKRKCDKTITLASAAFNLNIDGHLGHILNSDIQGDLELEVPYYWLEWLYGFTEKYLEGFEEYSFNKLFLQHKSYKVTDAEFTKDDLRDIQAIAYIASGSEDADEDYTKLPLFNKIEKFLNKDIVCK